MLDANHCLQIDPSSMEAQPIRNGEEKPETRLEYERHAYHSLKEVLQLKLQQRRTREELVSQGIMPPLKSPAAFHEQRRSLERARTEDYLKRKIRSRPERSELVRMHILEETSAEPSLQAKQLQLKRARLADDLNDKISHRPGPIELIHKNILPVHALIGSESPKGESSSLDEDSSDALSPDQPANHDSPLGPASLHSPSDFLTLNGNPSPTQFLSRAPPPLLNGSTSPPQNLTNGTLTVAAFRPTTGQTRSKSNADRPVQRPKKPKDSKPKVKKLKYHQYIPPDQKAEREAPPQLDSSYAKILQQQQLFLQLQILNQQQQHYNYHTILPAPPKPPAEQPPPCSNPGPSPSRTVPTPMPALSNQNSTNRQSQMTVGGAKPTTLPANLDDFKVAELKHELKLRRCTVSGTKNDLIERLRNYQEHNGGTTAGAAGASPGSLKAFPPPKSQQTPPTQACSSAPVNHPSKDASGAKVTTFPFAAANGVHGTIPPTHIMRFSSTSSSPPVSPTPSERSLAGMSPDETSCSGDVFGEMVSSPLTQLTLHPSPEHPSPIKEERHGLARPSCCFSSSSSRAPAPPRQQQAPVAAVRSLDKDQLLQEKDKQIEELTRMLRQKQQLVETLRSQLEQGRGGGGGMEVDVKAQSLANGTAQAPRVKEEVKEEEEETDAMDEAQSQRTTQTQPCSQQTLLRLQQIQRLQAQQQHQKAGLPQQLQHNTGLLQQQNLQQQNAGLQQQQQKTGLPQQQNLQQQNAGLQQQQQQKAGLPQQLQHNTGLLQQQNAGLQQQKAGLPQQQNLQQQNAGLQQQKAGLPQQQQLVIQQSQQKQLQAQQQRSQHGKQQQLQTQSQQVSPVYVNQQSGTEVTAPSFPLDLLKGHGTHTLVTDSNGNHYLIALTTSSAEGQHGSSPRSKGNAHITLQRLQSTPCKLPQPVPASPDSQSKQQQQTAPIAMAQKAGLHLETNGFPESSLPVSAPPNLQPFFLNEESSSSMSQTTSPPPVKGEACPSFDRHTLFTPPSPKPNAHSSTQRSKENGLCSQHIDDLFDILIKSGEISAGFRAHPDPSLSHLHSGAPSPPASPLLLSPPSPPPAAAPQQPSPCPGAGRLEDFLESSTGAPLLGGADPDGPLTLMGDLHSQMLSTAGLLDHAPVPMDTGELSFSLHPAGLDFGDPALDGMDWLDISMGGGGAGGGAVLAPLGSHAPPSVFSADFLDGADLQLHWDACL